MLFEKNIISQTQWQTAADALAQARAALAQAQAALVSAKKNLSYTIVTAPSDGVVGSIPQREGSLASPSSAQPLTTISDNSQVYAYFSLNEKELLKLTDNGEYSLDERVGRLPKVSLMLADGSVYPLQGRVATVSGVIDNTTGAAQVRALFDNPKAMLRSGSTGNVIIPTHSHNVILVPQKATFEIQDMKYVYTVNDTNGTAEHLGQLVLAVVTIAGHLVDLRGGQQPFLVVVTQHPDTDSGQFGKFTDLQHSGTSVLVLISELKDRIRHDTV